MHAVLNDSDEVIVSCEFADIKIVFNEDEDIHYTLWRRQSDKQYQIMWRGNFAGCMKEFGDIVGDILLDRDRGEAALRA